jgi:uncharacterized protein (DUF1015 family)
MAEIAPLTPLRYDLALLSRSSARTSGGLGAVVAPPYDVISPEQRAELAARDPHNVVRLILPEGEGDAKYANAAELFGRWRSEAVLVRDDEPAFYRYDQTFRAPGQASSAPAIRRRGFLALVRLAPFADRIVLPHERTLSGPKEDRLKLFRATRANLSPGFMLYRDAANDLAAPLDAASPLAEFTTADGVHHALAKVHAQDAVRAIVEGVARSTLLIADGHHRYETAVRYAGEAAAAAGENEVDPKSRGEHRYFMTFLVNGDDPDLVVFPTHRHVHSLPSFSFDEMTRLARDFFTVESLAAGAPAEAILERVRLAGQRGPSLAAAAADGRVVVLTLRGDVNLDAHPTLGKKPAVLRRTDVAVLHSAILESVLGITPEAQAAKTNLWYPQDAESTLRDLRRDVSDVKDGGRGQALFLMNATPVAQVREVAEAGEVMPQKSTFFYPKVATGLAVHTLEPSRRVADL